MMTEPIALQELSFRFTEFTVPLALLTKVFMEIGFYTMKEGAALSNVVPATLGPALICANILLVLPLLWRGMKRSPAGERNRRTALHLAAWGAAAVFLMSRLMPWKFLAEIQIISVIVSYIQFPWRLFPFALLFLSFSGAAGIWLIAKDYQQVRYHVSFLVTFVAVLTAAYYLNGNNGEHVLIMQTETVAPGMIANGEYLYEGTDISRLPERAGHVTLQPAENGGGRAVEITNYHKEGSNLSFSYQSSETVPVYAEVPLLYYPGYTVKINGEKTSAERGEQNTVRLWLQPGTAGDVSVSYTGLPLWNVASWISLLTAAAVCLWKIISSIHKPSPAPYNPARSAPPLPSSAARPHPRAPHCYKASGRTPDSCTSAPFPLRSRRRWSR